MLSSFKRYKYIIYTLVIFISARFENLVLVLQVISRKDQEQYWCHIDKPYCYVSIDSFIERFKKTDLWLQLQDKLSKTCEMSHTQKDALCYRKYSLSNWEMLKACSRRELLLMKRNSFVYVFKSGLVSLFIYYTCFLTICQYILIPLYLCFCS